MYAWGGSYKDYYKEQSLNGIAIQDYELQPIKFQGQSLDIETGLHYNRFRYYDSDVGMFIQRDPIGLLGGVNVFAYAPNPIGWIDPWGLSKSNVPKINDGFADWFNNLSPSEFSKVWSSNRASIERRLRYPSSMHEWLPVSRANIFHQWGVKAENI